ncbi:hypothetical protein H0H81_007130 [Sphagnurus paluster]|uniref:FAR-17a/AIG1-like protein n=1 Tax=Sphagnurus paluster TaxID=117069 RepID=A0A9P7K3G1_9AGAR|nr:hypothetical protein H0H81_007130 [Sphagnurus paluster]
MKNFYQRVGVDTTFDPEHKHVTSPVFSPGILAAIRLTLAVYTLFTLLFTLIWDYVRTTTGPSFFSYFTHLSYIGLCSYLFASGVQTFAFSRNLNSASPSYPLQRWPRLLQFLHVLLEVTVTTFPWTNISVHLLNVVFALFEVLLTNIPPAPWMTLPFGLVMLGGYLGVAYITHETQNFYPYSFLDPKKEKGFLAVYIAGIAIGYCIVFLFVRYVIVARARIVALRQKSAGYAPSTTTRRTTEEWEEVQAKEASGTA